MEERRDPSDRQMGGGGNGLVKRLGVAAFRLALGLGAAGIVVTSGASIAGAQSANAKLAGLIPKSIQRNFKCHALSKQLMGSIANYQCTFTKTTPASMPPDNVWYTLYPNFGMLEKAYLSVVFDDANTSVTTNPDLNRCGGSFSPGCESKYGSYAAVGDVVQYNDQNHRPRIAATVVSSRLLVIMVSGPNTGSLLWNWWTRVPAPWVNSPNA